MSICVPSVSLFKWHTVTIASCPADDHVMLLIKPIVFWSRRLYKKIREKHASQLQPDRVKDINLRVWVHGPLGSIALDWRNERKYKCFLLVGGGIGITPLILLYRYLAVQSKTLARQFGIVLIYTTRSTPEVVTVIKTEAPNFLSDNISLMDYGEEFEARIYITKNKSSPRLGNGLSKAIHSTTTWRFERPDLPEIFREIFNGS